MPIRDKATLKSYFEQGDIPTQAQFEDLIDSIPDPLTNPEVPVSRVISAQLPLRIDGEPGADLSQNRTLSILPATSSNPGYMSAVDKAKVDSLESFYAPISHAHTTTEITDVYNKRFVPDALLSWYNEGVHWGEIQGILTEQLDLKNALDSKSPINHTHTIPDNSISLQKFEILPANTIIGNDTSGSLTPKALTLTEVKAWLGLTSGAYVLKSGDTMTGNLKVQSNTQYSHIRLANSSYTVAQMFGAAADNDTGIFQLLSGGVAQVQLSSGSGLDSFFKYGNVGIGIAPLAPLHVRGALTGEQLRLGDVSASGNPFLTFFQTTTRRAFIQSSGIENSLILAAEYGPIVFKAAATAGSDTDTEYMRIAPGGNVGIGTGSPAARLDVKRGSVDEVLRLSSATANYQLSFALVDDGTNRYTYISQGSAANGPITFYSPTSATNIGIRVRNTGGSWNSGDIYHNDTNLVISATTPIVMLPTGNFGIGDITNPFQAKVSIYAGVSGSGARVGGLHIQGGSPSFADNSGNAISMGIWNSAGEEMTSRIVNFNNWSNNKGTRLQIQTHRDDSAAWNTGLFMDEYGRVAIAATSIAANSALSLPTGGLSIGDSSTNMDASIHIKAIYGGQGRMTQMHPAVGSVNASALNLIGSTGPSANFQWWSWGVTYDNFFAINSGVGLGAGALVIHANGNVGVSCAPSYKFQVNGQPAANGYTAFTNYSDARLKENIVVLSGSLEKICQLRPVEFNYNQAYADLTKGWRDRRRIKGFIAQELMEVFPEMVHEARIGEDGNVYLDANLSDLLVHCVEAIQELRALIIQ